MKTLADIVADLLEHRRSLGFSSYTIETNGHCLRRFLTWLHDRYGLLTADRLARRHLVAYQKHLRSLQTAKGTPLKAGSINVEVRSVRALLGHLRREGYSTGDLTEHILYVKEPALLPTSVLDHAQVRKLVRTIDTTHPTGYRNRTIVELLYSCGLRNMELVGLDLGDVDLDNATVRVMGKYRKERVVPVGRTALRYLQGYIRAIRPFWLNSRNTRAMFLNRFGERMDRQAVAAVFRRLRALAGIDLQVTAHTMRRSFTTELIRANANIYHVKELLGHATLESLQPYTKLTIADLKKTHAKCHPRERDEERERGG